MHRIQASKTLKEKSLKNAAKRYLQIDDRMLFHMRPSQNKLTL